MSIYSLKSRFQNLLRPFVRALYRIGVTANQVTLLACILSIALGVFLIRADRIWFAAFPGWMFVRMALNAIDGMLAREFGQKSKLGAYLNELTDVISDATLYLPFAFVAPFDWRSVGAVIFAAALAEFTGVVAVTNIRDGWRTSSTSSISPISISTPGTRAGMAVLPALADSVRAWEPPSATSMISSPK